MSTRPPERLPQAVLVAAALDPPAAVVLDSYDSMHREGEKHLALVPW
jgi:hypothetical protein